MEEWVEKDSAQGTTSTSKETLYKDILAQLQEITHNFREFWEEYAPDLTDEDLTEIHEMCRELELRMLVKFCNRLEE